MSKGSILKMALDEIVGGVKKVDLGDLPGKPSVAAGIQAVKRMAGDAGKKVADTVDDWGWKGGKPGEITGGEYMSKQVSVPPFRYGDELDENVGDIVYDVLNSRKIDESNPRYWDMWDDIYEDLYPLVDKPTMRAYKQLSKNIPNVESAADVHGAMMTFKALEDSDVPREWTGKLYKAIRRSEGLASLPPDMYANQLSNLMRQMYVKGDPETTLAHRETFLSLLPQWTESLDDLAEAARNLS